LGVCAKIGEFDLIYMGHHEYYCCCGYLTTSKSPSVLVMTAVLIELAFIGVLIYGMALLIDH
jgi:hypothetical protein